MKKGLVTAILVVTLLLSGVYVVHAAGKGDVRAFVETLIARNIIPGAGAEMAREMVTLLEQVWSDEKHDRLRSGAPQEDGAVNADSVTTRVSQLIEHSTRTYAEGDDIEGLLFVIENTADEEIELAGRRRCLVSYRILQDGSELYDSATHAPCTGGEEVHWYLGAGDQRMIPITHPYDEAPLSPGDYTFMLTYPGYGSGELSVTIE